MAWVYIQLRIEQGSARKSALTSKKCMSNRESWEAKCQENERKRRGAILYNWWMNRKSENNNQTGTVSELYLKQDSMSTQINGKWIVMLNLRDGQELHCKQ